MTLLLLGGSDTIFNDLGKNANHISHITLNGLSHWSFLKITYKVQFHLVSKQCET
jgi:hypothetical protein